VDHDAAKFCTVLPHGELEFGLWRESIRLSRSGFDAERLERARAALARRAVGQLPLERAQERLRALALQADWSLAHPSVPSVPELSMHSLGDARRFHRRHYRSNNAVLSLSGRFESDVALALARRYLGDQGWRGQPAAPVDAPAQRQTSPRLIVLERPELATPVYSYAWRIPAAGSADHAASELIAALLASSENPEVGVALVRKRGAAERVTAEVVAQQGTGLLVVRVAATSRGDASDVEKALHAAVARLRHSGPSAEELAAARRRLELEGWSRVESMLGKAEALGRAALTGVDLGHAADPELRYRDSAAEAVKRVAAAHLAPALLSAVEQYPKGWRDPGQAALPKFHIVSAGETLIGIAKRHGVELDALLELNGLNARRPIVPGQKLRIPAGGKPPPAPKVHVVKKGETLSGIAHRHRVSVRSLARQNGIDPKKPIRIGQSLVIPR
jgi:predicted Zn-dependent peptidase/LysM repeat protein